MEHFGIIILLLFGITFLGILSNRFNFPFPIVLVLSGVAISLIPGLPAISLNPDVVFIIFLPPLLYGAAWYTNWHEFRANARPIGFAAIGLVLFTTTLVAWAAHSLIPGIDWPTGFLIGAIVSPPDAIAATSVTKNLGLHPRLLAILEGESLVNDASGLIAYRYALMAITAGNFVLWQASLNFLWASVAGIAIGLVIGFLMYQIHKRFICDPIIEVTLTFLTPFTSYLIAEHFHVSGVLAVVSTGLFLSFRSAKIFSHESRIKTYAVWDVVQYILNGIIFIFIGLELREVVHAIREYKLYDLVIYGGVISAVVIVVRFVWVIPAALIPKVLSKKIARDGTLDGRNLVVFGWAGMRGVVSLAAALAIPLTLADGVTPFPHRNLVIYITFCVILSTLVILGFTLPWVIRLMKIPKHSIVVEEYNVRQEVVSRAITHIEEHLSLLPDEILHNLKSKYEVKYNRLQKTDLPANYFGQGKTLSGDIFNDYSRAQIDLISIERETLSAMHRLGQASDEVIRKIERELDLEESRLNMEMYSS